MSKASEFRQRRQIMQTQLDQRAQLSIVLNWCLGTRLDYQLSNARLKFGDQGLTFNLCCCKVKPAPFPLQLVSLWHHWHQRAGILLPFVTRNVARGNTVILSPKLRLQSTVAPYSTDNRITSIKTVFPVLKFTKKYRDWKTYHFPSISLRSSLALNIEIRINEPMNE